MAREAKVTPNAIRWLLEKGTIHPKKNKMGKIEAWGFNKKDQEIIRQCTSMNE